MKNLDKHEWEFSYGERYAVEWLEGRGYEVVVKRRSVTADEIVASKRNVSYKFRLPLGDNKIDYRSVMEQFEKDFELFVAIAESMEQL